MIDLLEHLTFICCRSPFFEAYASRSLSPSSLSAVLILEAMAEVLLLLKVSGMASEGTRPYFVTRLDTPVNCPPSLIGLLKSQSTFLSLKSRSLVSITPWRKRLAFSSWSQKNR